MSGMDGKGPPRPLLGDKGAGSWGIRYGAEFHMTNDRSLWTKSNGQLWTPREVCGLNWPEDSKVSFGEVRAAMAEKGFWPLYEGKHIDQWLTDTKPVVRWLSVEACEKSTGGPPLLEPKLVFRDIARNTDERTCITAVLDEKSCSCNTLATLGIAELPLLTALAVLNSLSFDYLMRFKTAGTHLNWTYVSRVPVPTVESIRRLVPIPSRSASGGGWRGKTPKDRVCLANDPAHFEELWRNEKAVAQAYGLTADEFGHILTSFPVMARKRADFCQYLVEQTSRWAAEGPVSDPSKSRRGSSALREIGLFVPVGVGLRHRLSFSAGKVQVPIITRSAGS